MDGAYVIMHMDNVAALFNRGGKFQRCGKMPFGFEEGNEISWLIHWLFDRSKVPCARNADDFLRSIGIKTVYDTIEVTHMVSLGDAFWVKLESSNLSWKDVSPFRLKYSSAVSKFALDGIFDKSSKYYFSPIIGTDGSFPHAWKRNQGKIYFVKGSSKYTLGGANSGNEPYSEYFASKVGQYLNFDCVQYSIHKHLMGDGRVDAVTECECYNTEEVGSVSARTLGISTYEELLAYCRRISVEDYKKCLDMLFLDCLLFNTDRHMGNVEFKVDNRKVEVLGIRPIYDNNYSLMPRYMVRYDKFRRGDYVACDGRSFDELYRCIFKQKSYRNELNYLKKFRFTEPRNVGIGKDRLAFLNGFLQSQVTHYFDIEK